jgi:lysylphosphatidylglycerol synthetase-like protein (DUF2156 family)
MTGIPLEARAALLRQHGTFAQAYSATYQHDVEHFGDDRGFIAFRRRGGTTFSLSDPITAPEHRPELIDAFIKRFQDVCFCQITRPVAELLAARRFLVNEMGFDTRIDLSAYSTTGRKNRNWRNATNRMNALGIVIKECPVAEIGIDAVDAVSRGWRKTRSFKNREVCFLTRPIELGEEPDVRKFYAFGAERRLVAFNFFDPIYEGGQIVGYGTQFKRRLPETDAKLNYAIQRQAFEAFRGEGRKWLYLGYAPCAEINDADFEHDWLIRRSFRFAYENGLFNRFVYNLKGHAEHKSQANFSGTREQSYLAFNTRPSLPRLIRLLSVCNML